MERSLNARIRPSRSPRRPRLLPAVTAALLFLPVPIAPPARAQAQAPAPPAAPADPRSIVATADAAFDAGDTTTALALYEQALALDPEHPEALARAARILSWQRRFDESIALYDRLLAQDPTRVDVALERARALSWARRYGAAAEALRALLASDPGLTEARLVLARTLSWSGRQAEARALYRATLAADPQSAEAAVGIAQTYAWSSEPGRARSWYERALELRPGIKDARQGLAYLDLWEGDFAAARAAVAALRAEFPSDPDVLELAHEVTRATTPWVRLAADRLEDSDENRLDTLRLDAGSGLGDGRFDLAGSVAHHALSSPFQDATASTVALAFGWRFGAPTRLTLRAGAEHDELPDGTTDDFPIGGATLWWRFADGWEAVAAAQHEGLIYSPTILSDRVRYDLYTIAVSGAPAPAWRLAAEAAYWELSAEPADESAGSGDNTRRGASLALARTFAAGAASIDLGLTLRWFDYAEDLDLGYFDPQDFRAALVPCRARGTFGTTRAYWDLNAEAGVQAYALSGDARGPELALAATGLAGIPLGRDLALEAFGMWSDYGAQAVAGFESAQFGIRLRWQRVRP